MCPLSVWANDGLTFMGTKSVMQVTSHCNVVVQAVARGVLAGIKMTDDHRVSRQVLVATLIHIEKRAVLLKSEFW